MKISLQFNRYFHAILNDILHSGKTIKIDGGDFSATIDTNIVNLEQLKMFFKMTDVKYEKTTDVNKYKDVFKTLAGKSIVYFFGVPLSMTELDSSGLSRHLEWIEKECLKNGIFLESDDWDRLLQMAEKI